MVIHFNHLGRLPLAPKLYGIGMKTGGQTAFSHTGYKKNLSSIDGLPTGLKLNKV